MITAHLTDELAQRLVDGALDPAHGADVAEHAGTCAACGSLVESYRALGAALDGLDVPELPADFTGAVLARIDVAERTRARERWLALTILAGVTAAACAVFALAGAGAWSPVLTRLADALGAGVRVVRIGSGFVPELVSALRLPIVLAIAAVGIPLLLALARLVPSPRSEVA